MDRHLSNLAIIYRLTGDVPKALEIFESALKYKEVPNYYSSIGLCYLELKNYKQAIFYHNKSLDLYKANKNNRNQAVALLNIGVVYLNMYHDDKALTYFNKSLAIAKEYEYPLIILNNKINIGEILKERKEFRKAKKNYKEILSIAQASGHFKQQLFAYKKLKEIALEEKQYKAALTYTEQKNKLNDSITTLQKNEEIAKLEVEYETLKKEKEISVLKKNQELKELEIKKEQLQKRTVLYAFVIILIPLIGLLFLYYQKLKNQNLLNKKQKEISEQKIDALIRNQELKLIKNSIQVQNKERKRIAQELHDRIGGNLAAIKLQFEASKNDLDNLSDVYNQLDDTYEQVRVLSHELIPKKFNHSNFIQLVKEYMHNIGKASKLNINISTYQEDKINEMDVLFQNELFSVFQELITNTIKHASASVVEIQIEFIRNSINVLFEDNGKGFDISTMPLGIGLSNIKHRIQKLSGYIDINSNPKIGTVISIEIPILKHKSLI